MTDEQHMPGCAALTTYRGIPANCNCELGRLRAQIEEVLSLGSKAASHITGWYEETTEFESALAAIKEHMYLGERRNNEANKLRAELKIKSEFLSSRQCADHAGKWKRGRCLQCEAEALRARVRELEADNKKLDERVQKWMGIAGELDDWQRRVVPELDRLVKIFGGYEGRPHDIERVRNLISEAEADDAD